jgi:hypothetical protein
LTSTGFWPLARLSMKGCQESLSLATYPMQDFPRALFMLTGACRALCNPKAALPEVDNDHG